MYSGSKHKEVTNLRLGNNMQSIPVLDTRNIPKHLFNKRKAYKQEI